MGLDMYLVKRKDTEVAYWRKANAIHNWMVQNVQFGEDDCRDYWVSKEKLEQLLDVCNRVLADNSLAPKLLPTQSGFFFGSTDYDEWYFEDVEYTKKMIEDLIEKDDFEDLYYGSSWQGIMIDWVTIVEYFLRGAIVGSIIVTFYSMIDSYKTIKDINKRIDSIEKILKDRE